MKLLFLISLMMICPSCDSPQQIKNRQEPATGGFDGLPPTDGPDRDHPEEGGAAEGNIVVYNTPSPEPAIQGSVASSAAGTPKNLQFRTIKSDDFGYNDYRSKFKTIIARFANHASSFISITLPSTPQFAELRSPTGTIPAKIDGAKVSFELPAGAGIYYFKSDVKTDAAGDYVETIVFWVDDPAALALTAPAGATQVAPGQSIQAAIDAAQAGAVIYLAAGTHEINQIMIDKKQSLTILMHPEAVIQQTGTGTTFIEIKGSDQITIKGPGSIQGAKGNEKTVFYVKESKNVTLNDFFLYKIHHRDGWTLHIYQSETVNVNNVRIISGNDGTDPDSSTNVNYSGVYIEAQDDAVAVKTRGKPLDGVHFDKGLAKSAASALKVGEATIGYLTTNIQFSNSTIFDSDRAMTVMPRGDGVLGNILYQNIRVKSMHKNKMGRTLMVTKSADGANGDVFSNAKIVFDQIEADFIETAELEPKITISNSTFTMLNNIALFHGTCPTTSALKVNWPNNGTGNKGC